MKTFIEIIINRIYYYCFKNILNIIYLFNEMLYFSVLLKYYILINEYINT